MIGTMDSNFTNHQRGTRLYKDVLHSLLFFIKIITIMILESSYHLIATILEIQLRSFFVTTNVVDELSSFDRDDHMATDLICIICRYISH